MKRWLVWIALAGLILAGATLVYADDFYLPLVLNRADATATVAAVTPTPTRRPPTGQAERLVFIHHSCGENWLNDGLWAALNAGGYFVVDTNYGWGPSDLDVGYDTIGDHTDIGHWYNWFVGPHRDAYLTAVYANDSNADRNEGVDDPGGENGIVMFKSCYPNSGLDGSPLDMPTVGANPLRGQDCGSYYHNVANAKGIYNDLLGYFATRPDKLFVVVTAPPILEADTDAAQAANARAFNRWLVTEWLAGYGHDNVFAFDFYNVLTSNGGDPEASDLGDVGGNHHRYFAGVVEYVTDQGGDFAAYPTDDSHPNALGNQKAVAEFVPLLDLAVACWRGEGGCDLLSGKGGR